MKKLDLQFLNEAGKTVTISLEQPVEPFDEAAINQAMDVILTQNVISSSGGPLVSKKAARIVDRTVEEVF
ncbi:DUF2922 domain-containing protein [Terribacillus saccharophilus]|uniref:DUF2922 domain-containing protein n=1 Tax=Terribacillus saccharophilus TaxID=361277 RepID=A0A268AER4_9BACI|nr:DUF2922 domain-containing protein [Terribacillus saccharophilus]MEC0302132.1 DUF2922 domain-containing protein [Terribacillus saccharophilus]PAD22616.1 hypothetical protein CHH64_02575 [Terribacillus saccharophilus]PAF18655.1 hypothetical protein CHH51_06580 [Terribacillus saccharophilus]PAF23517.1 hypothetical protein CHH49_02875 [Terribacillus saccharophilus]PAF37201.1 hypothetical protein CHH58_10200 [Terribacillus saccharophilus]